MAELRADILAAKRNVFEGHLVGANREINKLIDYLHDGETVNYLCPGQYDDNKGIIALTNERVIFLKDTLFNKTSQDFPYKSITSIEWKSRLFFGDIVLFSESFQEVKIEKVPRNLGFKAVKLIREGMRNGSLPPYIFAQNSQPNDSVSPSQNNTLDPLQAPPPVPAVLSAEARKKVLLKELDEKYSNDTIGHSEYLKRRSEITKMQ